MKQALDRMYSQTPTHPELHLQVKQGVDLEDGRYRCRMAYHARQAILCLRERKTMFAKDLAKRISSYEVALREYQDDKEQVYTAFCNIFGLSKDDICVDQWDQEDRTRAIVREYVLVPISTEQDEQQDIPPDHLGEESKYESSADDEAEEDELAFRETLRTSRRSRHSKQDSRSVASGRIAKKKKTKLRTKSNFVRPLKTSSMRTLARVPHADSGTLGANSSGRQQQSSAFRQASTANAPGTNGTINTGETGDTNKITCVAPSVPSNTLS